MIHKNKLKQCPFCGSEPILEMDESWYWNYHIFCPECNITTEYFETANEAKQAWNRRAMERKIQETSCKANYNPCDDCQYSYSRNGQEMSECKICEFNRFLQLEKAGKILVVQCSIGDRVFEVQEMRNWIQEYIVTSIHVSNHTIHYGWKIDHEAGLSGMYGNLKGFTTKSLGERVFLSREEAQRKLDELNSKEEE